jgi:hypothetical protein
MAGIKSKVELSVLDLRSSVCQEMKIEGKRELIDRPIDDLLRQEASILRPRV